MITDFVAGMVPVPILGANFAGGGTPFGAAGVIDASGEKFAHLLQVPKTGTLAKVGFKLNTVTSAQPLKVSFQDMDLATGFPDGVIDQYRVVSSGLTTGAWIETGIMSSDGTDTGTKRSVTRGDYVAVVMEFDSTVGNMQITGVLASNNQGNLYPSSALYTTSWAKVSSNQYPTVVLIYDDGSVAYSPFVYPIKQLAMSAAYSNATATTEIALKLTAPAPIRVCGAYVIADLDGDCEIVLYDSAHNILTSVPFDKDLRSAVTPRPLMILFPSDVTLNAGATYKVAVKPTSSTSLTVAYMDVNVASYWNAIDGNDSFIYSEKTSGNWTDTATRRPLIGLIISGLDNGSSVQRGSKLNRGLN